MNIMIWIDEITYLCCKDKYLCIYIFDTANEQKVKGPFLFDVRKYLWRAREDLSHRVACEG